MEKKKLSRAEQAKETKRHIFDVALQLLDERPFEEIKVRDIVKAANVSIGTFYNYYTTKLDVFYETYQLADEYFSETVAPKLRTYDSGNRILRFFDEYARYSSEITDISLTKLLYHSDNKNFDGVNRHGMRQVLLEQVEAALKTGEFRTTESAENIVTFLMIAARGLVYHWCTHDGSYTLRPAMARYMSQLLRSFQ